MNSFRPCLYFRSHLQYNPPFLVIIVTPRFLYLGGLQQEDELTKALCACCKFVQQGDEESSEELISMIQDGSWCYKLAGFQLLSK